MRMAIRV
jgi:hypothetical protein